MTDDHAAIRPLTTRDDCVACVALQREIWGHDFVDVVPATLLMVTQQVGGVATGAFDRTGRLLGFVFGISGVRDGAPAHWSDMLGVRPEARRQGLGRRLKLSQRDQLLALGIERVYWSYDPLAARNARLNLTALGAYPVEYVVNMYGDTGSVLHRGLDTDRLIVEWRLRDPAVERAVAGKVAPLPAAARAAPLVTGRFDSAGRPADVVFPGTSWARAELPSDVEQLKRTAPSTARRWQLDLRRVLTTYLHERHARIAGFYTDSASGRCYYVLHTPERHP